MANLEADELLDLILQLLPDNTEELITPEDLRTVLNSMVESGYIKKSDLLSVNQLRGGLHLKSTLAQRDAILAKLLAVGMKCFVATPTPTTYELVRDTTGPLMAYQDGDSTTQVKARWLPVELPGANLAAGIEPFNPRSPTPYRAASATGPASLVSYTLASGPNLRFFTALKTMSYAANGPLIPAPTELAGDTNWREASPPAASWVAYQTISYQALRNLCDESKIVERRTYGVYARRAPAHPSLMVYCEFDEADSPLAFGARMQNSDELFIYNLSTDTLTPLDVVEVTVEFPGNGLQQSTVRVNSLRKVGTWQYVNLANVGDMAVRKNGVTVNSNSFTAILNDLITVTGTSSNGGGVVIFNVLR